MHILSCCWYWPDLAMAMMILKFPGWMLATRTNDHRAPLHVVHQWPQMPRWLVQCAEATQRVRDHDCWSLRSSEVKYVLASAERSTEAKQSRLAVSKPKMWPTATAIMTATAVVDDKGSLRWMTSSFRNKSSTEWGYVCITWWGEEAKHGLMYCSDNLTYHSIREWSVAEAKRLMQLSANDAEGLFLRGMSSDLYEIIFLSLQGVSLLETMVGHFTIDARRLNSIS